jgi:hypothetical protein
VLTNTRRLLLEGELNKSQTGPFFQMVSVLRHGARSSKLWLQVYSAGDCFEEGAVLSI